MSSQPGVRDSVLRNRSFVTFWISETASLFSFELTKLVLPLVAVIALGATTFQVGALNASIYAPIVLFSLLVGVWLDRRRRRPMLIVSNLVRAALIALVPLASFAAVLSLPILYVITFLVGTLTVVFEIGSLSYVPSLVERRHLAEANSRIQISFSLAAIAGPSLGGVLTGVLTAPNAVLVSVVGFLSSAGLLSSIRRREPEPPAPEDRASFRASVMEGLRTVYASSLLRNLLAQSATFNLVYNALLVVFIVYMVRYLEMRPGQVGFILGIGPVAALAGAFLTNRITRRVGLGRTLRFATYLVCLPPLLMLVPRDASIGAMALLMAAQLLVGFNLVVWNVNTLTLRQIVTPDRLLGRMNASYRMVIFGAAPIGALLGGTVGDLLGLRTAMIVVALLLISPIAWTFFAPVFRLAQMPAGPQEEAGAPPVDATGEPAAAEPTDTESDRSG